MIRPELVAEIKHHWKIGITPEQLVLQAAGLQTDIHAELLENPRDRVTSYTNFSDLREECPMYTYASQILSDCIDAVYSRRNGYSDYHTLRLATRDDDIGRRARKSIELAKWNPKRRLIARWLPHSKAAAPRTVVAAMVICIWVARQYIYIARRRGLRGNEVSTGHWAQHHFNNKHNAANREFELKTALLQYRGILDDDLDDRAKTVL